MIKYPFDLATFKPILLSLLQTIILNILTSEKTFGAMRDRIA